MTGLSKFHNSVRPAKPPRPKSASTASPSAAAFKSQPALKKRSPLPVTTATLKLGSLAKLTKASPMAWDVRASIALALGRFKVMSKTAPWRSQITESVIRKIGLIG